ncbi:Ovarian cancer-associated protein 2 [Coemansia thaxteri]|uniref:Ovarian cancer-associated protein 2 n=1 Tax=Coemansia thaxteri TaxID=2663907 RepID=A0A9W8BBA5_9FUNG|nr:Ovarian cancer-associated protein 2 [Coemansia thaxteri]
MPGKLFRVLCLHGYTQSAQRFRERTGPFRRGLKNEVELVYVTAPHPATDFASQEDGDSWAWWNRMPEDADRQWSEISASLRMLGSTMREQGPFDGVMGFSQGAGMAAMLLAALQAPGWSSGEMAGVAVPRFAILIAGFYPDMMARITTAAIRTPALVVVGTGDALVPAERGRQLAERAFARAQVAEHAGGHFVPGNSEWRARYREFLLQKHIL